MEEFISSETSFEELELSAHDVVEELLKHRAPNTAKR